MVTKIFFSVIVFALGISAFAAEPVLIYDFPAKIENLSNPLEAKGQSWGIEEIEGQKALQVEYNAGEVPYLAILIKWSILPTVPEFQMAKFLVHVYLPENEIRDVCFLLVDAKDECFQFRKRVIGEKGWTSVEFPVNPEKLQANSWKWGKNGTQDGKLDQPVRFGGIQSDFCRRQGVGFIGLKDVSLIVEK